MAAAQDFLIRFQIDLSNAESGLSKFIQRSQALSQANIRPPTTAREAAATGGAMWGIRQREMDIAGASKAEIAREQAEFQRVLKDNISNISDPAERAALEKEWRGVHRAVQNQARKIDNVNDLYDMTAVLLTQNLEGMRDQRQFRQVMTSGGALQADKIRGERTVFRETAQHDNLAANDPKFAEDHTAMRTAQTRLSTALSRAEEASEDFVQAMVRMRTAQADFTSTLNRAREFSDEYIQAMVRVRGSADALRDRLNRATLTDPNAVAGIARQRRSRGRVETAVREENLTNRDAIEDDARRTQVNTELILMRRRALEGEGAYIRTLRDLSATNSSIASQRARLLQEDALYILSQADLRAANLQAANNIRQVSVDSGAFARGQTGRMNVSVAEQQSLLETPEYIEGRARREEINATLGAQVAVERDATTIAQAKLATDRAILAERSEYYDLVDDETAMQRASTNMQRRIFNEEVRLREVSSAQMQQLNRLQAQRIAQETVNNRIAQRQIVDAMRANPNIGFFQTMRARAGMFGGGRMEGGGASAMGMGGFFGSGLMGMARYALPSALAYGGISMMGDIVNEAEELERVMTQIESQLEQVGRGDQMDGLRQNIMEIARDTGVAAQEVAEFAYQLGGAFEGERLRTSTAENAPELSGEALLEDQLRAAAMLTRLTDITQQEAVNGMTAVSLAFGVTGGYMSDVAFEVAERTGVVADEIINFMGKIAPAAQDARFELEDMAVIAAVAQQRSGVSGTALAEQFGRIIPAINGARTELNELALANTSLGTPEFMRALAENDVMGILMGISQAWDTMGEHAQGVISELIGSRREAQTLVTIFNDFNKVRTLRAAIDDPGAVQGATERRFEARRDTLNQQLAELAEQFRQLGIAVFNMGIGDAFMLGIAAVREFMSALEGVFNVVGSINDATGGLAGTIATIVGVLAGLVVAINAVTAAHQRRTMAAAAAAQAEMAANAAGAAGGVAGAAGRLGRLGGLRGAIGRVGGAIFSGPGMIIGAGVLAVGHQYQNQDQQVQDAADQARQRMSEMTIEELQVIKDQHNSFLDKVSVGFFGEDLPSEIAEQFINEKRVEGFVAMIQPALDSDMIREYMYRMAEATLDPALTAVRERFQNYAASLDEESKRKIEEFLGGDVFSETGSFGGGGFNQSPEEAAQAAADRAEAQSLNPDNFDFGALTPAMLTKIQDEAKKGTTWAVDLLNHIIQTNEENPEILQGAIDQGLTDAQLTEAEATNALTQSGQRLEEIKADYEAGRVSVQTYLAALDALIQSERDKLIMNPEDAAFRESEAQHVAERNAEYAAAAQRANDLQTTIDDITMPEQEATTSQRDRLIGMLQDPQFVDPDARRQVVSELIDVHEAFLQARVESFENSEEALNWLRTEGRVMPPEIRQALIRQQLEEGTTWFLQLANALVALSGTLGAEFVNTMIQLAAAGDTAAMTAMLNTQIAAMEGELANPATGGDRRRHLETAIANANAWRERVLAGDPLAGARDPGTAWDTSGLEDTTAEDNMKELADARANYARALADGDPVAEAHIAIQQANEELAAAGDDEAAQLNAKANILRGQQQLRDALNSVADARSNYRRALVEDDPLAAARIGVQDARRNFANARGTAERENARAEIVRAQRAERDEIRAIADARADYAMALVEGDPVRAAQQEIENAQRAFREAGGEAERLQAMAARVRAERGLQEAIRAIADAQIELLMAQAEYAGDTVRSAELALEQARVATARAREDFAAGRGGEEQVIQREAEELAALGRVRDENLATRLRDYEYLYEMEQINKQQMIAYLQSLKQIPDLTTEQLRDIDRRIKQLNQEMGADLQFNLPTNLELPTLYEARRLNQTPGGGGYQDNRNVTITMYVTDGMTADQAAQMINEAVGGGGRIGTTVRRY